MSLTLFALLKGLRSPAELCLCHDFGFAARLQARLSKVWENKQENCLERTGGIRMKGKASFLFDVFLIQL